MTHTCFRGDSDTAAVLELIVQSEMGRAFQEHVGNFVSLYYRTALDMRAEGIRVDQNAAAFSVRAVAGYDAAVDIEAPNSK